ncbi:MAG: DTW domain-containing protein [Bdellovibrionales bacterium]|nr:DTW domain-containing protein [Bdellovibrionales bacterium]
MCLCSWVRPFDCNISFVILQHPLERRRRIATGRLTHLFLQNSYMIHGHDYDTDRLLCRLIQDPKYVSVILYPQFPSLRIDQASLSEKKGVLPRGKKLRVLLVDGTWATAKKTIRNSSMLSVLPRISFVPAKPSKFEIRKQPNALCLSTLEATHACIEYLSDLAEFDVSTRQHDHMLTAFYAMIDMHKQTLRDRAKSGLGRKPRKVEKENK